MKRFFLIGTILIFFISNSNAVDKVVNVSGTKYNVTYKNTNYEKNPLWEASIIRIFALRDLVCRHNLQDIIHFDNDVLI